MLLRSTYHRQMVLIMMSDSRLSFVCLLVKVGACQSSFSQMEILARCIELRISGLKHGVQADGMTTNFLSRLMYNSPTSWGGLVRECDVSEELEPAKLTVRCLASFTY